MTIRQARTRFIRRAFVLSLMSAAVVVAAMSVLPSPTAEAGKPGGTATGATLDVKLAPSGGRNVIVSGSGFSAGKSVVVAAKGPYLAPIITVTASSTGTFSYEYTLPSTGTWTFEAYEEARSGLKLKAKLVFVF